MPNLRPLSHLAHILVLAGGCTPDCPNGEQPRSYERLDCDEVSRTCVTRTETVCPCHGSACGRAGAAACMGITGVAEWVAQAPSTVTHVVDGAFTGAEWDGATKLEGLFTDVYMGYRGGRLHFLNDWRSNNEGIRPECFNYFQIRVGTDYVDLRVFGDGHVDVTRNYVPVVDAAQGAYGFGPSPSWSTPHTIYEFSLAIEATRIDVCCFDPVTMSQCDQLTREPVAIALRASGSEVQVTRQVLAGVTRLAVGASCGRGEGVCQDGSQCEDRGGAAVCVGPGTPDAGSPSDGGPPF